jgi:dual specificity phosphatase 12
MKKYRLSYDDALERLKTRRPFVSPNYGFEKQLRVYHANQYTCTPTQSTSNAGLCNANLGDSLANNDSQALTMEYKCKLCRHKLFTDADLVQHIAGTGRFDHYSKSSAYKAKQNIETKNENFCQQELFTNQPAWLGDLFEKETNDGDIECPNSRCQMKLGRYSLIGEKCTCAKWVNPAFHFHRSKIDQCSMTSNPTIEKLLVERTTV